MNSASTGARRLRGALVGATSMMLAASAHTVGGGDWPSGAPLVVLLIVCATVGAGAGALSVRGRCCAVTALALALGAGQVLGHLVLMFPQLTDPSAYHHGAPGFAMPAAHAVAALGFAALISMTEYLYAVCGSVLCWLRLFLVNRSHPRRPLILRTATRVVVQPDPLPTGLGMRAPPGLLFAH